MAFQGPPPSGMRHAPPGMMPPAGIFPPPHPPYGPPPMMMVPHMGQPGMMPPGVPPMGVVPPPGMPPPLMVVPPMPAPHLLVPSEPVVKVPIPSSTANMKVATTVFVGNISEKASDTLIRQILLRCGPIEGWKRVQDATGKLQGFGFCEYADPESTLRALRLLHNLKLGEKSLVAKVDAKTRKDLLKYLLTRKHIKKNESFTEGEVEREVEKLEEDKDAATAALISEVPNEAKSQDGRIQEAISNLLKDYLSILSSTKTNEDIQRERDVKESILFMAKQSGNLDPDSTLEDMDMEDDMKTLVSDEIKRFRESYKRSDEARKERKARDKERDRDEERGKPRVEESGSGDGGDASPAREKPKRERSSSPAKRDSSPRRGRSPLRSRSQERQEKEKRREALRQREKEDLLKGEEEYEERMRQRRMREREKAYKMRLSNWEKRETRKEKDCEKDTKRDRERRDDMERERKHLGDFLGDYDDNKDDQKYYKGSAYGRRRRERDMEMDSDDRDRNRERDELEELRLQVIERQAREMLSVEPDRGESSGDEESPMKEDEEDEDMVVPAKEELEEDIPLTKSGYTVPPAYPPIQVHSAPSVNHPVPDSSGFMHTLSTSSSSVDHPSLLPRNNQVKQEGSEDTSPASYNSPTQPKLAFGLKKSTPNSNSSGAALAAQGASAKPSKLGRVFTSEEDEVEKKPKKKLVPIEYSDEEGEEPTNISASSRRSPAGGRKRSRHHSSSSGKGSSSSRRRSSGNRDVGIVMRGSSLSSGDGMMEDMKDRKLTADERKKMVQTLVNNIPTSKEEVFEYQLKWDQIDKGLIEKRVGPWINKKITEYIGEAEPILTEFICNKLSCHISPGDILNDISMVLDDEAEVFIVKLWRLLIYETEAKHLGIAKSY